LLLHNIESFYIICYAKIKEKEKMEKIITDKQMEIILKLVASKFETCKNMEYIKKTIQEIKETTKIICYNQNLG